MSGTEAAALGIDAGLERRMLEIRRHLHRHPELSNEERETQAYLGEVLRAVTPGSVALPRSIMARRPWRCAQS